MRENACCVWDRVCCMSDRERACCVRDTVCWARELKSTRCRVVSKGISCHIIKLWVKTLFARHVILWYGTALRCFQSQANKKQIPYKQLTFRSSAPRIPCESAVLQELTATKVPLRRVSCNCYNCLKRGKTRATSRDWFSFCVWLGERTAWVFWTNYGANESCSLRNKIRIVLSLFKVSYRNTLLHHMKIEQLILIRTNLSSFSTYMKLNELLLTTKNKIKTKKEKTSKLKQNVNI